MQINWKCAKSGHGLSNELAHLYLPGGHRITGKFDGARYLTVIAVHCTGHSRGVSIEIDPGKVAACIKAGTNILDTFAAVSGILPATDTWNTQELADDLAGAYKIVLDSQFDAFDTYSSLPASSLNFRPAKAAA